MKISLENRVALITGSSRGLGRAIARAYVKAGANVILCARNEKKLFETQTQLQKLCNKNQKIIAIQADVSKKDDVNQIVSRSLDTFKQIHILVNNAGIYGTKGRIENINWNEWIHAIEINLFGSILMMRALLPHFRKNKYGKIIQLSGGGATSPLPFISAYATSKAAIVRFAESLSLEVQEDNIDVNSIAPGALNTRLLDEILESGSKKVGMTFYKKALKQKKEGGVPLECGADLSVFLASKLSDGITGKLISAVWDPWEKLPEHFNELKKTDIYTLRRIVPKERGMEWGEV